MKDNYDDLADFLGLSASDLDSCEFEIHERTGHDDVIYGYYIEFGEETSLKILKKVNADEDRCVDITGFNFE
ncbi:MAG: hypothetical protein IPM74_16495 [Crocinitomicaceae bacterium]|nr:hypothetical protein [Crocinitomicaceae bacterium]